MENERVLSWKDAVHFVTQILRALQHAHERGIVHRDIKPQNIMMFTDGTIKVMDFGIAKFAREEGKTATDQAIGTVHYISPEQARGDVTDAKSDLYSVGVMLYEMLTGQNLLILIILFRLQLCICIILQSCQDVLIRIFLLRWRKLSFMLWKKIPMTDIRRLLK